MSKDGDSTTSLAILCQCSTILTEKKTQTNKKTSPTKKPFATCQGPLKRFWLHLLYSFPAGVIHSDEIPPDPSLPQAKQSQLSQPLVLCQTLQILHPLCGPLLDFFRYVHVSYWWAQSWSQHCRYVSPVLSWVEGSPPSICWQHSCYFSPGCCWPTLPQEHIADWWQRIRAPFGTYSNFMTVLTLVILKKPRQPNPGDMH